MRRRFTDDMMEWRAHRAHILRAFRRVVRGSLQAARDADAMGHDLLAWELRRFAKAKQREMGQWAREQITWRPA